MKKKRSVSNKNFEEKLSPARLNGWRPRKCLSVRALQMRRILDAENCKKNIEETTGFFNLKHFRRLAWRDLARPALSVGLKLVFGVAISYIGLPYQKIWGRVFE